MRLGLFAFLVATIVAAPAWADFDWLPFARVSQTMTVSPSRLCMGASENTPGRHNVIGCPSYAPSITTAGDVSITGNVSANKFIGDGSGLTGVTAGSSDRIVSGTTSMVAISNTGYISLTQSGVNTGWFNPQTGFVTIGVSSTGPISATSGYLGGGIDLFSTLLGSPYIKLKTNAAACCGAYANGIIFDRTGGGASNNIGIFTDSSKGHVANADALSFALINTPWTRLFTLQQNGGLALGSFAGNYTAPANSLIISGNIGIGTTAPNATLQVSGTLIVSNSSQVTTPSIYVSTGTGFVGIATTNPTTTLDVSGTARFGNGTGQLYAGSGFGGSYSMIAASAADLTNGQGILLASGGASYFLTTNGIYFGSSPGNFAGYFRNGGLSIGATFGGGVVPPTNGLIVQSKVGISTTTPSQTLHIDGMALISSWTAINFPIGTRVTPTAPLEVSGTISATNLVINGQTITGGASSDRITSGTSSIVVNSATSTISFSTAGSQRMTIDGSGNVGIGTTAPYDALDVSGTFRVRNGAFAGNGFVVGQNSSGHLQIDYKNPTGVYKTPLVLGYTGGAAIGYYGGTTPPTDGLAVAGNVGIGTTSPNQTLSVSGTAQIASNTAIGMNATPSATLDISGTMKLSGATGSEVCDAAHIDVMRKNPTTGSMEVCVQ